MTVATVSAPHGPQAPLRAVQAPSGAPGRPTGPDAPTAPLVPAVTRSGATARVACNPTALIGKHARRDSAVLELAATGLSLAQIARRLTLSQWIVDRSAARLRVAYDAANSAHVTARALACGDLTCTRRLPPRLTGSQFWVLAMVAEGRSNAYIGSRMGLTEGAGGWHINGLLRLFGVPCRPPLVVEAYRASVLVPGADGRGLVLAGGGSC